MVVAGSLIGAAVLALGGCASSMTTESTQHSDSAITSAIGDTLAANENVKARKVDVQTREGVVYLTGVVDTEDARREAADGVTGLVHDDLVTGTGQVERCRQPGRPRSNDRDSHVFNLPPRQPRLAVHIRSTYTPRD